MLGLMSSACLGPADDIGEATPTAPEHAGETSAALGADEHALDPSHPTSDAGPSAPDPSRWMIENVPLWNVYLGGFGYDRHKPYYPGQSPYWDNPRDASDNAPLVVVRAGDEERPERWIQLSLYHHWMKGPAYFDALVACGLLSPLDLLAIRAALQAYGDRTSEPPSIATLPAASFEAVAAMRERSRIVCPAPDDQTRGRALRAHPEGGGTVPLTGPDWPLPGGDHTGPAPSTGKSSGRPGGGVVVPPRGPGSGRGAPGVVTGIPNNGFGSNSHRNDKPSTSFHDQQNGVFAGDPKPRRFESPGYVAGPGEREETFRCEGAVYVGYKHGCVDFWKDSTTSKWDRKIDDFTRSYFAVGGDTCKRMCNLAAASPGLFTLLCIGSTTEVAGIPCAYIVIASTFGGWLGGATFPDWCAERWCTSPPPEVSRHACHLNPDGQTQTCRPIWK